MRLFDYDKACGFMDELGIDLVLVYSPANVGYFADYDCYINGGYPFKLDGTDAWTGRMVGVPRKEELHPFIVTWSYEEMELNHFDIWIRDRRFWGPEFVYHGRSEQHAAYPDLVSGVVEAIQDRGLAGGRIAVEMAFLPADKYLQLQTLLPQATFVDAEPLLWKLRYVKSPEEIRRIRKAAQATDAAVDAAYAACHEGMTELQFQKIIKQTMVEEGAAYGWSSVGFGPKGALFVMATEEQLRQGEIIRVDACAVYQGYFSDISRVRIFGTPSDAAKRAHDTIYTANRMLVEKAHPGVRPSDLYHLVMNHLEKAGYQSLSAQAGHGLGRDVHEPPMLAPWNHTPLEPNVVVVIEPTMRVLGVGSVNVEDMILITESGNEPLTTSVRELVPCGTGLSQDAITTELQ